MLYGVIVTVPASVALAAGLLKLRYQPEFRGAVVSWRAVPGVALVPTALAFPCVEVAVAVLGLASLLVVGIRTGAALALLILFAGFTAGQVFVWVRAPAANCGCLPARSGRIGAASLTRSVALAVLAAIALALA